MMFSSFKRFLPLKKAVATATIATSLVAGHSILLPMQNAAFAGYDTNKWGVRESIVDSDWEVVYFEEIDSWDAVGASVSTYVGGPAGFSAWYTAWITQALNKFGQDSARTLTAEAQAAAESYLSEFMEELFQGRLPSTRSARFGAVHLKAGVAQYSGCNTVRNIFSGRDVCAHPRTPSWQPYVAVRYVGSTDSSGGGSPSNSTGFNYHFSNSCDRPVRLALSYQDMSNAWVTESWWTFEPGESAWLSSDNVRLSSNNANYYYYAETTDGSNWNWGGDHMVTVDNELYGMKPKYDAEGHNEWAINCDNN